MILDYLGRYELPKELERTSRNELTALKHMADGLRFLNETVSREQSALSQGLPEDMEMSLGIHEGTALGVLASAFGWYSLTAYAYARLVGWLITEDHHRTSGGTPIKKRSRASERYARKSLPDGIRVWRNHVAAHAALVQGGYDPATRTASVMDAPRLIDGTLVVGSIKTVRGIPGVAHHVSRIVPWSLTETHAELGKRYWP